MPRPTTVDAMAGSAEISTGGVCASIRITTDSFGHDMIYG
ncbi:hypothetical protein SFOMI_2329 [Sphingobium fuliginis]|uniref:Uncharacterized protein n=1 Tax=Sphingobium fuliginis (strain ATCC 27551) TaxID=336203 RepID=A0A292ZFU5_SPHSA|nr:hypothetical protein SFOMI_2329 [Sphingobium fuliginis]